MPLIPKNRPPFRRRPNAESFGSQKSRSPDEPRRPAVSGILYPSERPSLEAQVDRLTGSGAKPETAIAALLPHGSYASCGAVIGEVYARVSWPETVVLIGPNHSGVGQPYGVDAQGKWQTPLGEMAVDEELARALLRRVKELKKDTRSHGPEHSLELQLPFLQRRKVRRILPIAIGPADPGPARRIGEAVAEEILRRKGNVGLIASSNLTRYEPLEAAQARDPKAIERLLALDGAGSVLALLAAARRLGASKGRLVRYQTSDEAGADPVSVSGYAGIVF
ncbi:MAG: AmmeMemoRadiSam system protein B [Candidatus Omnitrophica bacterium]|nr:AmmeMemoRadiSam system protein B [Candidatus Omnitrophota bacterium]